MTFSKRNKTLSGQSKSHQDDAPTPKGAKTTPKSTSKKLQDIVVEALEDSKAEDIVRLELDGKSAIADEMIVATGRSNVHVSSITDKLIEKLKENGHRDLRVEGQQQCDWVLVDAGDVIIHIFRPEVRIFYNLEKLWSPDAPNEQQA